MHKNLFFEKNLVKNKKNNDILGYIEFDKQKNRYIFQPEELTFYDSTSLITIAKKLQTLQTSNFGNTTVKNNEPLLFMLLMIPLFTLKLLYYKIVGTPKRWLKQKKR